MDKTYQNEIQLIENGTVDQVSVGMLPKQMICSADGFDFFGEGAGVEHIFTGTTPDGHTVGKNGVYCKMVGLENRPQEHLAESQKLTADAIINLYEIRLRTEPVTIRVCDSTTRFWQGNTYEQFGIQVTGEKRSADDEERCSRNRTPVGSTTS
ncbi:hypothetical protein JF546_19145 [Nitratireductor aquimarinus]|uniref:hypothetical protein n=1 Tax=Nitratireductor aquimarinus TaxID=889300 RepID=UPI001A8C8B89|nr:hypothetical protein [Nitratireductor aquimarinus]MBN8245139.1 hypothetical protein [Nitratireductor aquimarinus]MBY6133524.1 hypothetical protein [Nitratireductor aquimarinus]MCA1304825.1 hypothetical protein [Nitratireductor aquimarinus]